MTQVSDPSVFVVIRTVGERTENACKYFVEKQVPPEQISVVRVRPFAAALKESFVQGIEAGRRWTICVDADVLLAGGAIRHLVEEAEKSSKVVFNITGHVVDKFYGRSKSGGPHLYRTSLLPRALELVQGSDDVLRPETRVKEEMQRSGFLFHQRPQSLGAHGHEQFYGDIFRQMVVRSVKSKNDARFLLNRALFLAREDHDFSVASWGLKFGSTLRIEEIELDHAKFAKEWECLRICNDMEEKGKIAPDDFESFSYERLIHRNGIRPDRSRKPSGNKMAMVFWKIGRGFSVIGARIQHRILNPDIDNAADHAST